MIDSIVLVIVSFAFGFYLNDYIHYYTRPIDLVCFPDEYEEGELIHPILNTDQDYFYVEK